MAGFKWGIISTGNIARKFAGTLSQMGGEAELYAVSSRGTDNARAFADEFGAFKAYGSYEELALDPDVQAVYIGTPHSRHYKDIMLCLSHGKHVLCEKSFTVNAAQAREGFAFAKEKGLFLMEAYWTRFTPGVIKLLDILQSGEIGEVQMVTASYGFRNDARRTRKFDPQLAGGALLDIGVYNISFAAMALGYSLPEITSQVRLNEMGTDAASTVTLTYPGKRFAQISTAIQTVIPQSGVIAGSEGYIAVDSLNGPQRLELVYNTGKSQVLEFPFEHTGFEYQIREVQSCVLSGKLQSDIRPPEHTIAVLDIMDSIRAQWGMSFPCEKGDI